jgi:hypothetical protein
MLTVTYAERHIYAPYAECCYPECRYAKRRYAKRRSAGANTLACYNMVTITAVKSFMVHVRGWS